MLQPQEPAPVLIVDDSADDIFFLRRILTRAAIKNPLVTAYTASQAQRYLTEAAAGPDHRMPCVVITDLNMPVMDGIAFVQWIRSQAALRGVRLVMLTSATGEESKHAALAAGVDCYLEKFPAAEILAGLTADRIC